MLGKKLRLLMANKEINQRQLAEILGVTQGLVSFWLKNKKMPGIKTLKKMADYFNVSIDLLMDDMDPDQDPEKMVKNLTEKDLDEELFKALESLPAEFKQDLLDVAEKLDEKVKTIEREISKRRIK